MSTKELVALRMQRREKLVDNVAKQPASDVNTHSKKKLNIWPVAGLVGFGSAVAIYVYKQKECAELYNGSFLHKSVRWIQAIQ